MKSLFPKSALAHHIAILGKTGSGKTSVAKAAVIEPALEANERICVVDPTGAWWGLRLKADGKTKGFPVYVFGGRHADYPLLGSHGEAMADVIGTTNTPAILDTSLMKGAERTRFFTDFADAILRKNEGPLRIAIDEAHVFMPQAGTRGAGAMNDMLHAGNNLISLGRSRGLRIILISQRAAKLHKDSLTQVETLIALRLIAPQDRQAVREWIADQADVEKGKDIIASLPKQNAGQGWVWAPEADFLKQVQFPMPITYDSSAAPTKAAATKKLSPIDLNLLKDRLAKVDQAARENDPKLLRADLTKLRQEKATLEQQVADAQAAKAAAPDKATIAEAEKRGFDQAEKKLENATKRALLKFKKEAMTTIAMGLTRWANEIGENLREIDVMEKALAIEFAPSAVALPPALPRAVPTVPPRSPSPAKPAAPTAVPRQPAPAADGILSGPQRQLLQALRWWKAMGHDTPTRVQAATLCGWKITSGHLKNIAGSLKTLGLIDYPSQGSLSLTPEGLAVAPEPNTGTSLLDSICAIMSGPQRQVFDVLPADGAPIERSAISDRLGWNAGSGHLKNIVGSMRSLQIVEYPSQGTVARADWLRAA